MEKGASSTSDIVSDGLPAVIVVEYDDVADLEQGQPVRVIGTVLDPIDGTNAMGGERTFPAIKAEFME